MANTFGFEPVEMAGKQFGYEPAEVVGESFGFERAPEETTLLSKAGATSIAESIVPSFKRGLLGAQLFKQENPDPVLSQPLGPNIPVNPLMRKATPGEIAQTRKELEANKAELDSIAPENPSYPLKIATGAVQSISQNLPGLMTAVATRRPEAAIIPAMAMTKGQSFAEDRSLNPLGDPKVGLEAATKNANIKAGIEGALETIPTVGLLKDLGKDTLAKTAGKFIAREELTEIPTTILQKTSDQIYAHPDKPMPEFLSELGSDVIDTAVTTPFAAGGTVAIVNAQQRAQDALAARKIAKKQRDSEQYKADALADLQQNMQESMAGLREPPPQPGMIRVYHSGSQGEGDFGRWVSTSRKYASGYRPDLPLFYLDVPATDPRVNDPDYPDEQGVTQGFTFNFETTPAEAALLTEIPRDPDEALITRKMEQPAHTDIPDAPLTEEQEKLAQTQLRNMNSGATAIPADPVAQADSADLDVLLSDPVYKQPEDIAGEVEAQVQHDMDRGMSEEVARRRATETHPNQLSPTQRPIAWSSSPEQIGLNLTQTQVQPGGVVLLGGNEDQFSPAYVEALGQTIQSWAQRWMPADARILLNLSGLKGEAVGGYQQSVSGVHIITPRELVRTERGENQTKDGVMLGSMPGTGYNAFTQQQTFGAISHEFGHALTMAAFAQNMPPAHRNVVNQLDAGRTYSEQELAQMPQLEAAVIRDYQAMKAAVLSGKLSAEELVERWLGTWKLGKDLLKRQRRDLYSHAKEVLLREGKRTGDSRLSSTPLNLIPARTLIHAMGRNANVPEAQSNAEAEAYYLQFNEYMAEQFSRYAHANRIDQGTALGIYFRRALQSLRELFKMLKTTKGVSGERIVKPGTSFQEWVDGLVEAKALRMAQKEEGKKVAKTKKPRAPRKKKEKTLEETVKEVVAEVKQEEADAGEGNAPDTLEQLAEEPVTKEALRERVKALFPEIQNNTRAELMRLIARGRLEDATDLIESYEADRSKVKRDIDPSLETALKAIGEQRQAGFWQRAIDFVKRSQHSLLQMQQLAHSSDDEGVRIFVANQNKMMALKNNLLQKGTEIAKEWEHLSRRNAEAVEKVLMDEWQSGGHSTLLERNAETGKWEHTAGAGFQQFLKDRGIDGTTPEGEELAQLILHIKDSILEHIQVIEDVAIQNVKERYRNAPLVIQKRAFEIRELARKWRMVPFVPQSHYGNFVVKVFDKDAEGNRVVVYQGHFETAAEQDAAVKKLQKAGVPADNLRWNKLDESVGPQLILPKDFLESLADTGEFSSDQLESVADAMTPLRPDRAFSKLERDASRILGASQDILRNYANWIEDSANFTSKLAYSRRLSKARAWTRSDMNELMRAGDVEGARQKQRLLDTMTKAQQFILHPMDEWFQARSAIALTYLMYAPKTALMNATGLFQSWAAMTADYGDLRGNAIMAAATKDLITGNLTEDEHWMKNKALEDGIIDQGFGYFMSGLANAGNLSRRIRPTLLGKAARGFVDLGMFPFKAVETGNRNLTMLAIYRAERLRALGHGKSVEEAQEWAYNAASRKTRLLQNDYASGNRPEILRGKKSLFMIFLSYPQYMLWIMSGGYERGTRQESAALGETPRSRFGGMTMRMWLIFLAMSGLEGVPFGESLVEFLQRLWNTFGRGENLRVEGHRFLKDTAGIESMYWRKVIQRGFLHDVLGTDLSGSYSLGKPLPGLGLINPRADNWQEFVGEAFEELSGPFGGVVKGSVGLGMTEDIGAKELGQNLPGTAGSIARTLSASESGLKTNRGERILRDENGNLREPTTKELALIGTGFRLSEVARFQELEALKRQQVEYWNGRRTGLKKSYLKALEDRDPKLREDVDKAIAGYNAEIPHKALRLTGKELREFTRNNTRRVRRLEQDRDPRRVRALNRDISRVMGEP